ncbi:MAG TPA: hypothetical protein ENN22_10795 [bacterium]|nr:hypothetical protein [bacterium]
MKNFSISEVKLLELIPTTISSELTYFRELFGDSFLWWKKIVCHRRENSDWFELCAPLADLEVSNDSLN